ncbi:MAG: hypothetical protein QM537_03840 [Candidatus Symbiobacter sp.]|nr:hypothetical protein [Candidatus Symbiobacter sp.]
MVDEKKFPLKLNRIQRDGLARITDVWAGGSSIAFATFFSGHLDLTAWEANGLIYTFIASILVGLYLRME